MKSKTFNLTIVSLLAASGAFTNTAQVQASDLSLADHGNILLAQATTNPQPAPSFLKQAGKMLMESAQKKVLQNVNDRLQNPQAPAATTPAPDASAAAGAGATTSVPLDPNAPPMAPTTTLTTTPAKQSAPCRSWVDPREKPLACLLCVHGLGLQSNSYEFFGQQAAKQGLAVYAIDVRGFGSWMQAKGKAKVNFDECLADIKQTLESIRAANPGLPVYIMGESMGGAIALRAASMYPDLIDGLISSVPAGERFNQGKTSMKVFMNLLAGFNINDVGGDVVNAATKNAKLKAQWQGDPLARLNLTPQELIQFQDFMNSNHEAAKKVADMPVLFVQGNGDTLVKPEGTWELFNSVAAKDKSFFAVPGEHLIFEEAQTQEPTTRDQNFRVISSWLSTKVGRRNRYGRNFASGANGGGGAMGSAMGSAMGGAYGGGQYGAGAYGGTGNGQYGGGAYAGGSARGSFVNTQGLEAQAQLIDNGQYAKAIADLEQLRAQRPNDPNLLGLLGKAYYQNGEPDKAGYCFRRAMRMAKSGGQTAQSFNSYLLDMSRSAQTGGQFKTNTASMMSPFAGFAGQWGFGSGNWGTASAKGKVYAFYANWADQCKGMSDTLNRLAMSYGNSVDINRVNIEDAGAEQLIDKFKIGPIPTVVFVSPNGQVSSTIIGESAYNNYDQAIRAIAQTGVRTR